MVLAAYGVVAMLANLRYSARSFARAPGLSLASAAHDCVGHWQQCRPCWDSSAGRLGARSSAPGDRDDRFALRAGLTGRRSAPCPTKTICRSQAQRDAFEVARRRARVARHGRWSRALVGHVGRRRDARARRASSVSRSTRASSSVIASGRSSLAPRPTLAASRFASTASTLAWPASRRTGSKVCTSAVPSTSGCR